MVVGSTSSAYISGNIVGTVRQIIYILLYHQRQLVIPVVRPFFIRTIKKRRKKEESGEKKKKLSLVARSFLCCIRIAFHHQENLNVNSTTNRSYSYLPWSQLMPTRFMLTPTWLLMNKQSISILLPAFNLFPETLTVSKSYTDAPFSSTDQVTLPNTFFTCIYTRVLSRITTRFHHLHLKWICNW